ncbi:MAG: sugar phosphate isomerase/epimerase [Saprospiraceae bacterium]|jgi:sugar phosphate isomerase/epimerase
MTRRKFIDKAAVAGAAAFLPISRIFSTRQPKYKMGYQLFSIRDAMAKDPLATLKELITMGYEDFEVYGYDEINGTYYGYEATEFKKVIDDLGVTITSGHYGFAPYLDKSVDEMSRYVDKCIEGAKILNSNYITWPWIAPEQRTIDNFKLMASKLNVIGEQVNKAGLGFAYHNHGFEFEDHNGENGFDIIISDTDAALVKLQIDMYWVMHSSNYTPKELISTQPGRYVMWHIKDMDKVSRDYTELGNGSIDYLTLLPDPIASGLEHYYIEQGGNYAINSTQSARDSGVYLKNHLQKFL